MSQIRLEPANPLDVRSEDLHDLAQVVRSLGPEYEVEISGGQLRGVGVTWWEVINVWVPWDDLRSAAAGALVAEVVRWLRDRFKTEPRRPKVANICGPEGQLLRTIALRRPD